jgi:UDP-2,3-diacylglucosamine hydrolase
MQKAGATCLAIDAGKCLLMDGNAVVQAADSAGLAIVAE